MIIRSAGSILYGFDCHFNFNVKMLKLKITVKIYTKWNM
jgi:hypothetical protein